MSSAILPAPGGLSPVLNDRKIRFEYAVGMALLIEIALVAVLAYWSSQASPPAPQPKVIAVHMLAPPPAPVVPQPPAPAVPQPPKPVVRPLPTPKPPPVHHQVVHHHVPAPKPVTPPPVAPPIATPVATPQQIPAPVVPTPVTPPPPVQHTPPPPPAPVAPPEVDTGIAPYGAGARGLIQGQLHITALIKRLGLHGTVTVSFKVAPSGGKPYAIAIVGGSQNPLIRKAALDAINASTFPPYTHDMPQRPLKFTVPIEITAE